MKEDATPSQTIRAVLGLRSLVIQGELKAGERVLEQLLVDRVGVSRTPARTAMARVCEEGLLEALPQGGYAVAQFSAEDVSDAIAIRGTLEGMAARMAAERGAGRDALRRLHQCVDMLDNVVDGLARDPDLTEYVRLNDRFHELLLETSQSAMVRRSLTRLAALPFATPNAFVSVSTAASPAVMKILVVAQDQHRGIAEAVARREGARAQALAIEHSRSAWKYLHRVFAEGGDASRFPGLNLIDGTGLQEVSLHPAAGPYRANP